MAEPSCLDPPFGYNNKERSKRSNEASYHPDLDLCSTNVAGVQITTVEKITLLALRYKDDLAVPDRLLEFISGSVDIVCVSISWDRHLDEICRLLKTSRLAQRGVSNEAPHRLFAVDFLRDRGVRLR